MDVLNELKQTIIHEADKSRAVLTESTMAPTTALFTLGSLWELQDCKKPSLNTTGVDVEASPLQVIILGPLCSTR